MLDVDARIAVLAAGQFGIVSREQLLAEGMTARMIDFRVSKGLLVRIHRGVYALPSVTLSWRSRLLAAQLCLGDRAFMSHRSAALYWRLDGIEREFVEFTLKGSALRHRLTTFDRVKRRLNDLRRPGLRGAAVLGRIIDCRDPALAPTESIFETRFYRLLKRSRRIPPPVRQHRVFDDLGFVARLDLA